MQNEHLAYRVQGIPLGYGRERTERLLRRLVGDVAVSVRSLAVAIDWRSEVATVSFAGTAAALSGGRSEWRFYPAASDLDPSGADCRGDDGAPSSDPIVVDTHFLGLTPLKSFDDASKHRVDLLAISGLGGHAFGSFKERGGPHMWLRDSLLAGLEGSRVLLYGYDARVHASQSFQDLEALGSALKECVHFLAQSSGHKPLGFIAHSLGGLVVKEAIIQMSHATAFYGDSSRSICGAFFFGVPSQGMKVESLISMAKDQPNQALLHSLGTESQTLRKQHREFLKAFDSRDTWMCCFYETSSSPTALPVDGRWKMCGPPALLVSCNSATHCRPWEDTTYNVQALPRNHSDLVKYSRFDPDYLTVLSKLRTFIKRTENVFLRTSEPIGFGSDHNPEDLNKQCVRDLRLTDPRSDMDRIEQDKGGLIDASAGLVLSHPDLRGWRDNSKARLLWINGDAGKGKTMMTIALVRKFFGQSDLLSFVFCESTRSSFNSAVSVLRGLIYLIVIRRPILVRCLEQEFNHAGSRLFEGPNAFFDLKRILLRILQERHLGPTYLIVDALDECDSGLQELLELIGKDSLSLPPTVRWIVASRYRKEIECRLERGDPRQLTRLKLDSDKVSNAVRAFIAEKVETLAQEGHYDEQLRQEVKHYLEENANDTFLWVSLVCKALGDDLTSKVRSKLKKFPPGLGQLYKRMIGQLLGQEDEDDVDHCRRILVAATLAYRPLSLKELGATAGLPPELSDRPEDLRRLVYRCGSFLSVQGDLVSFVHQSAKDFLISREESRIFPTTTAEEHRKVACRLVICMSRSLKKDVCGIGSLGDLSDHQRRRISFEPLAHVRYACCFWIDHLCQLERTELAIDALKDDGMVHRFLREHLLHWLEALGLMREMPRGVQSLQRLQAMLDSIRRPELSAFVADAVRFVRSSAFVIQKAPLQTYCSALVFSPRKSIVRQQFSDQSPSWLRRGPTVDGEWGPLLLTPEGHTAWVHAVAFSPDGWTVASGSWDETVKLWDPGSGSLLRTLEGHTAFSPDGRTVASGSWDRTVKLWDPGSGELLRTFNRDSIVFEVSFSSDGQWLYTNKDRVHLAAPHPGRVENLGRPAPASGLGRGIFVSGGEWVCQGEKELLWLPQEYRSRCTASRGDVLAMGHESGRVSFMSFDMTALEGF
ncbi:hypothetical protein BDY21DRAFT_324439 [Lineolata rhizophorae]|uniref:NACHT domain-containing protein n=1 Tax=Lineolata rhizophorae TaxID=578093 RepID=A0A6A6NUR8_9PEZI|nr:hypothetical protein BDY21DRAFT_324439 [Lineolata rhizophorae]